TSIRIIDVVNLLDSPNYYKLSILTGRSSAIIVSSIVIVIIILDLLMTRQLLPYDTNVEMIMFTLTVVIGYGIGSWILFAYTTKISKDLRTKSTLIRVMHFMAWLIQFSLLVIISYVLYNELYYGSYNNDVRIFTNLVYVISSFSATVIMSILCFKFFSW